MSPDYPYQLVSFLDKEPAIDEDVYQGENGWYPQIALKRRFKIVGIDEGRLLPALTDFANDHAPLQLETGHLIKPDRMPVRVIEILNDKEIKQFHLDFIAYMDSLIESRYPERDGEHYLPHITAEYAGDFVINVDDFVGKTFTIDRICLIKDKVDTDSHVVAYFELGGPN